MKIPVILELEPGTMIKDGFGVTWIIDLGGDAHALYKNPLRVWTSENSITFEADYGPFSIVTTKEIYG